LLIERVKLLDDLDIPTVQRPESIGLIVFLAGAHDTPPNCPTHLPALAA
jgi:hypothetical protein